MKTLFMFPLREPPGGATIAAINIASGLSKLGVEVHVATASPPHPHAAPFLDRLQASGVILHSTHARGRGLKYWRALQRLARRTINAEGIDVAHPHTPRVFLWLGMPAKLLGRKVVLTLEGDPDFESVGLAFTSRWEVRFEWWLSRVAADHICPCSLWLAEVIRERFPRIRAKVTGIPNPVDYERLVGAVPAGEFRGFTRNSGEKIIFSPARLHPVKGLDTLIKAARYLLEKEPNAKFIIAGEGPSRNELETAARAFGVSSRFCFLGFRPDVGQLLAASDVVVLPSTYEPFGLPAAEAGALGKPAVVSSVGGLGEIVEHGVTGLLVPPKQPKALADALERLLKNEELRRKLGEAARERVRLNFTPEAVGRRFLEVYNKILSG